MKPRALLLTALLTLPVLAAAQDAAPVTLPEIPPVMTPLPGTPPAQALPTPAVPSAPSVPAPAAVALPDVQATLSVPRTVVRSVTGKIKLTFTVRSSSKTPITFSVRRDNQQNCVTAPQVRVLEVGTRAVVYPVPGASPRLCAQDLETKTAAANGNVTFTRELELAPGEYVVESWLTGFANNLLVKVPAAPVRITVK